MKIAIVGAGISGLTAAYLLNREHEVDVYERADYAGGHAHTVSIDAGDREVALDTGFIVYNEHTYPGFTSLLRKLGVKTKPGDMSMSVRCRACDIEYSSRGIAGFLAQRSNVLRPARALLVVDMLRFYRDARRAIREPGLLSGTLAEFTRARRYSGEFSRHFLFPLASAVWSTPRGDVGEFPAEYFIRFMHNHGIIGFQPAFVWRTIEGGSKRYISAMTAQFSDRVRLKAPVRAVRRDPTCVTLMTAAGQERYDRVVVATHANEALHLLTDASREERAALSRFQYSTNKAVLHTDSSTMPANDSAWASWNYFTTDCRAEFGSLGMTYHLNRLQALQEPTDYFVSLNAANIRPDAVIDEMSYEHPTYTFDTLTAQRDIETLQGQRRTYFAGAHLGYGFHEDGLQSGVRIARSFGIEL